MIKHTLFDLDDTLYPASAGLMQEIRDRMREYMIARIGIPESEVDGVRQDYWNRYGTTLRGLYLERQINAQEFLAFVHDIPVAKFLKRDARLHTMLTEMPQKKSIFTNAPASYARRVLNALGVEDFFTRIYDINYIEYESKPAQAPYQKVLAALDTLATECAMVDDTAHNLVPAQALGMRTVLVKGNPHNMDSEGADAVIETIYDLPETLRRF